MKIDIHNYEEFMLSFVDNELNEEDGKALLLFLEQHPELQHELKLLQSTRLSVEENIIFSDKNPLYRKENAGTRKGYFLRNYPWLSIAAAACLLLFVALFIHPWKKQTLPKEIEVNTLPVQKDQSPIPNPVNSPSKEMIHKQHKAQEETLAIHQSNKNTVHSMPQKKESNTIAKVLPAEESKPALPAPLPEISSPSNENNSLTLNGNKASGQLPLENIAHSIPAKQIDTSADIAPKNNKTLMAKNKPGSNEDLVQKVDEWRKKPGEIIENIHEKGLRIGKITIAFNN